VRAKPEVFESAPSKSCAVRDRTLKGMRSYWDEAARKNAVWYVDTSTDFASPDLEQFFATGRRIAAEALDDAPAVPSQWDLAVEIGSGLGRNCLALAERFDAVIGVDVSPEMVAAANDCAGHPKIRYVVGDGSSLPIDDATADLVLSFTVFQHIPSSRVIERYIEDAGRVLRPGGVLVFQWNNERGATWWRVRRAVLSTLQRARIVREQHERNDANFLGSRVPLARIEQALGRGGLELVGTRGAGTLFAWAWARRA
jgi:SAM-dependent methyltransferase